MKWKQWFPLGKVLELEEIDGHKNYSSDFIMRIYLLFIKEYKQTDIDIGLY